MSGKSVYRVYAQKAGLIPLDASYSVSYSELISTAKRYQQLGMIVIPVSISGVIQNADGVYKKEPVYKGKWQNTKHKDCLANFDRHINRKERTLQGQEIWVRHPVNAIGLIMGPSSNNTFALDIDDKEVFYGVLKEHGHSDIDTIKMVSGCGGEHWIFQHSDETDKIKQATGLLFHGKDVKLDSRSHDSGHIIAYPTRFAFIDADGKRQTRDYDLGEGNQNIFESPVGSRPFPKSLLDHLEKPASLKRIRNGRIKASDNTTAKNDCSTDVVTDDMVNTFKKSKYWRPFFEPINNWDPNAKGNVDFQAMEDYQCDLCHRVHMKRTQYLMLSNRFGYLRFVCRSNSAVISRTTFQSTQIPRETFELIQGCIEDAIPQYTDSVQTEDAVPMFTSICFAIKESSYCHISENSDEANHEHNHSIIVSPNRAVFRCKKPPKKGNRSNAVPMDRKDVIIDGVSECLDNMRDTNVQLDTELSPMIIRNCMSQGEDIELVQYMNNYVCRISSEAMMKYAIRDTPSSEWIVRPPRDMSLAFKHLSAKLLNESNSKNPFDIWSSHAQQRVFKKQVFDPRYIGDNGSGELNHWTGFCQPPLDEEERNCDMAPIEAALNRLLTFILEVLFDGDENAYRHFMKQRAHMIQFAWIKTQMVACFKGDQGLGKNTFTEWFGEFIIGKKWYHYLNDIDQLTGDFNLFVAKTLYLLVDEGVFAKSAKQADRLKSLIVSKTTRVTAKFMDGINMENFMTIDMLTNNERSAKLDYDDRRFMISECNPKYVDDGEFWTDFNAYIDRSDIKRMFFIYLARMDLSTFSIYKHPPMTKTKQEQIDYSKDAVYRFVDHILGGESTHLTLQTENDAIPPQCIYDEYLCFVKSLDSYSKKDAEVNQMAFTKLFKKYMTREKHAPEEKKIGSVRKLSFDLTSRKKENYWRLAPVYPEICPTVQVRTCKYCDKQWVPHHAKSITINTGDKALQGKGGSGYEGYAGFA